MAWAALLLVTMLIGNVPLRDPTAGQPETNRHLCLQTKRPGLGSVRNRAPV